MSTKRHLKEIFGDFLKAHPEAKYIDGRIYLRPISQVAWSIILGTTSIPEIYHLRWGPREMFIPGSRVAGLKFPIIIPNSIPSRLDNFSEIVWKATEEQCLSHVPEHPTLDDLYTTLDAGRSGNFLDVYPEYGAFFYAAKGDIECALEMSTQIVALRDAPLEKLPLNMRVLIRDLHPLLLAGDRKGIGALLRQHEHRCVVSHKLEKFWEPAPYPVELQA